MGMNPEAILTKFLNRGKTVAGYTITDTNSLVAFDIDGNNISHTLVGGGSPDDDCGTYAGKTNIKILRDTLLCRLQKTNIVDGEKVISTVKVSNNNLFAFPFVYLLPPNVPQFGIAPFGGPVIPFIGGGIYQSNSITSAYNKQFEALQGYLEKYNSKMSNKTYNEYKNTLDSLYETENRLKNYTLKVKQGGNIKQMGGDIAKDYENLDRTILKLVKANRRVILFLTGNGLPVSVAIRRTDNEPNPITTLYNTKFETKSSPPSAPKSLSPPSAPPPPKPLAPPSAPPSAPKPSAPPGHLDDTILTLENFNKLVRETGAINKSNLPKIVQLIKKLITYTNISQKIISDLRYLDTEEDNEKLYFATINRIIAQLRIELNKND